MADGIYVSMCGAAARTAQLDAIADNLANAQTPGFKAARPSFEVFLPASGAPDKAYPAAVATGFDLRPGPPSRTDNPLDVLPEDGAFLMVRTAGGGRAFTRDGRLQVDAQGLLVQSGRPVLDRGGEPIHVPPGPAPQLGADGSVRAGETIVGELGLFRLSGAVDRVGPALLAPAAERGGRADAAPDARLRTGELELGNAGALEATVQLIGAQRQFDASMQALQTYRAMDQRSNELGRVR
jgi:flagellar basal-body rod protein FlgF